MACQAGTANISLQTKIVFEVVGAFLGRETVYATIINSVIELISTNKLQTIFINYFYILQ